MKTVSGPADPLAANLKRAQEASRVLEELSKPVNAAASSMFGDIRFRLYDIEKDIAKVVARARRMPEAPFLYAVAGYEDLKGALTARLTRAGAGLIQLRDKDAADAVKLERAKSIRTKIKPGSSLFVVNDRVDIALASGADAVHLGAEDMPVDAARDIAGDSLLIGRSSNSYREAMTALEQRPDYLAVGAIFHSPTKPDRKQVGLKLLSKMAQAAGDIPIVAIGGINLNNIKEVLDAGASGAAVVSAITQADDAVATLKRINEIFDDYRKRRTGRAD
jgi:thiamine-phosphate pyrophosphorylase